MRAGLDAVKERVVYIRRDKGVSFHHGKDGTTASVGVGNTRDKHLMIMGKVRLIPQSGFKNPLLGSGFTL